MTSREEYQQAKSQYAILNDEYNYQMKKLSEMYQEKVELANRIKVMSKQLDGGK